MAAGGSTRQGLEHVGADGQLYRALESNRGQSDPGKLFDRI